MWGTSRWSSRRRIFIPSIISFFLCLVRFACSLFLSRFFSTLLLSATSERSFWSKERCLSMEETSSSISSRGTGDSRGLFMPALSSMEYPYVQQENFQLKFYCMQMRTNWFQIGCPTRSTFTRTSVFAAFDPRQQRCSQTSRGPTMTWAQKWTPDAFLGERKTLCRKTTQIEIWVAV